MERLRPWFETDDPNPAGEIDLHCPLHDDVSRSAQLNVDSGLWCCQVCGGGAVDELIKAMDDREITSPDEDYQRSGGKAPEAMDDARVAIYVAALWHNEGALEEFKQRRGIQDTILHDYQVGWDDRLSAYTLPIYNGDGELVNIRRYQLDPSEDRRKIWSVKGHGGAALFPIDQMEHQQLVVCEGEWDALICIQNGVPAITRTAAAKVWYDGWNNLFTGKDLIICHDRDTTGVQANTKVRTALRGHAARLRILHLPFKLTPKHGKDLTDWWREGHSHAEWLALLEEHCKEVAVTSLPNTQEAPLDLLHASVAETFNSAYVGRPVRVQVAVTGKVTPSYLLPERIVLACDQGAGAKCDNCSLNVRSGHWEHTIQASDPVILQMINRPDKDIKMAIRESLDITKGCPRWTFESETTRTVEELYVRPSITQQRQVGSDFTHRRMISVGTHNVEPNQTIDVVGTLRPNPFNQKNEFQIWNVDRPPDALDTYELNDESIAAMDLIRSLEGPVLKRLRYMAEDLTAGVTMIYGRAIMHAVMDLVLHSVLEFDYAGQTLHRGWLDAIIFGDTRTGKSEAATRLLDWYNMGEMISCETATFAGVMGGLDRTEDNRWVVKWGVVPMNDRRAVILDEMTGLSHEQIAQMSSIRSSGVAELTKIRTERTAARTRMIWMANPRSGSQMNNYTYGVQALKELVGHDEDIARFDLAMSVASTDVSTREINRNVVREATRIPQASYREVLRWAWTRKREHVMWAPGAVELNNSIATQVGAQYISEPPLVQGANIRVKLARIAVALAARMVSTDTTHELVVVTNDHVKAAHEFITQLYGMQQFGYGSLSRQRHADLRKTHENLDSGVDFILRAHRGLLRFLKGSSKFKRQDLEDVLNASREASAEVINRLWDLRMIVRDGAYIRVEQEVQRKIREIEDD